MKKLSRITEAEVIAEFLKAEFYRSEFARDRHKFEPLVYCPNLADRTENAIRRALLFRRRASMWSCRRTRSGGRLNWTRKIWPE